MHGWEIQATFPLEKQAAIVQRYPVLGWCLNCVQCFRVSVTHQTLTWATGSLTCVHDHSYACAYTQGLGTPITSQHNILTQKNCHKFFLCSGRGSNLWSLDLESMLYTLSHPRWAGEKVDMRVTGGLRLQAPGLTDTTGTGLFPLSGSENLAVKAFTIPTTLAHENPMQQEMVRG